MQTGAKLFIKGMVCHRCIIVVKKELEALGIIPSKVALGEVTIISALNEPDLAVIDARLKPLGFSLLEDIRVRVVREVKQLVEQVYSGHYEFSDPFRFSNLINKEFHRDYNSVSGLFTLLEQQTIEQYIINYRIEKVKEYLVYTQLTLSEIAYKLNFSS